MVDYFPKSGYANLQVWMFYRGSSCYNCSCDLSYCVSDCEEDSRGTTLRLKYKTCTMSNWEATSTTHYIFRSMGDYCVNVTGGRCMNDGSYWCSC